MSKLSLVAAPLLKPKKFYLLPQNLIKASGTNVEDFEDATEWTENHGAAADDAVNYKEGTQGVKVTADIGAEGEIQKSSLSWAAIGSKEIRFWAYISDMTTINVGGCKIQLWGAGGYVNRKEVVWYPYEGWNLVHLGPDDWTLYGTGSLTEAITDIRLRHSSPAGETGEITYDALYFYQVAEPSVVISFDDNHTSVYDKAYPIMKQRNMVGTAYIITDNIGGADCLTWAECVELQAAGWVIANHTEDHADLTGLNEAECETNLTNAITAMTTNGITGNGPYHLAYPGGTYNATVLKAMSDVSMLTGRTIEQARQPALPMDRAYEIQRIFDLDSGTSLATAKSYIDEINDNGKIGYIYGHIIAAVAGATAWAEDDFIDLCDYIAQKRIACLTIEDAYQLQSGSRKVRKAR